MPESSVGFRAAAHSEAKDTTHPDETSQTPPALLEETQSTSERIWPVRMPRGALSDRRYEHLVLGRKG